MPRSGRSRIMRALDDARAGCRAIASSIRPADPGDLELLRRAHDEERVLVTLDKDFGELAIVKGEPHSGIVRLVGFAARQQGPTCSRVLTLHSLDLTRGAIVTAEPGRIRV